MTSKIFFSVITATYNSEKTLKETIESLLSQTYTNFEYIIIDGASQDNTVEIIKHYESTFKEKGIVFKWISEPDTGIYNAWNKGLKMAEGDYISFLGSDDIYYSNALERFNLSIADSKVDYDFIGGTVFYQLASNEVKEIKGKWEWSVFKYKMNFCHTGGMHSLKYFNKYGIFDDSYIIAGDYELLLRAKKRLKIFFIPYPIVFMRTGGVSSDLRKTIKEHCKASIETGGVSNRIAEVYKYWRLFRSLYLNKKTLKKLGLNIG